MTRRAFGFLPCGATVEAARISAGALTADVIGWGAALRDLRLAGAPHPLVLGFDALADYVADAWSVGVVCGRVANRIAHGRFSLDGRAHALALAPGAAHHLHGGPGAAFGARPWALVAAGPDHAEFALHSPDGDGGYPGALTVRARYSVHAPATLALTLTATADAPTVVNLAHHGYWNLDGAADVAAHRLTVAAEARVETDAALIPTGALLPVAGGPWDFRAPRLLDAGPYDGCFALARARAAAPRFAASLTAGGVTLALWTTEPGLQLFDAAPMAIAAPGLQGRRYGPRAGVALEAQGWPDAPNRPAFPSVVLRPGETYAQRTEWRLSQ